MNNTEMEEQTLENIKEWQTTNNWIDRIDNSGAFGLG